MGRELIGISLATIVVILVATDLALRRWFGFGHPLLYVADDQIGYLLAPNQDVRRFGNRILINAYSMRGEAIAPTRPSHTLRLFLLGDSIANGGWWTDHNETISARLQQHLSALLCPPSIPRVAPPPPLSPPSVPQRLLKRGLDYERVEVLNASANSWGPRNELAYINAYGCFEAQLLILLLNTDDLFATAPTSLQVGRDRNYPAQRPPFAWAEIIGRYLLPPVSIPELEVVRAEGGDRVGKNLDAIQQLQRRVAHQGGRMVIALTPLLREVGQPGPRDYERMARDRLMTFTQDQHIPYLDLLPALNAHKNPASLYRDHIHFNSQGNQFITEQMIVNLLNRAIASL
jgi:hypothetical protein